MDPQTLSPGLPLEVVYWAVSSPYNDTQKVKFCDVHPEYSWILSAEKNLVNVWDFMRKDCLMEKTLLEILESVDKTKTLKNYSRHVPMDSFFPNNRHYSPNTSHSDSFLQVVTQGNGVADSQPHQLPQTLKSVGDIKRVVFIDRVAMQWTCGGMIIPPTLDTFHSPNRVMIICDGALIFYDFVSGMANAITPSDLNRVGICSAEFIYPDLCAIGGSDGLIRIWDCLHWKLVKTLTTTYRGEISTIRNLLPRSRVHVPQSGSNDSGLREGRIRMLSIGADGSGLLWDSLVMGNIIQINEPTGHLLSQGSFAQHLDDASDTLITVSSDRTIRMWDLTSVKKSETGTAGKIRPGRRASLTGLSSSSAGSEHGRIPCVGKIKPGNVLSPALSKFTHITHLEHPRYPYGTFAITSKTNTLGIVQIQEATADEQSEKSSVRSSSDTSLRLVSLHEITLSQIMAAHAAAVVAHSNSENTQDSEIFNSMWLSSRDPNTKVYTAQSHPMFSDIIIITTAVGVIVLRLKSPVSANAGLTGFHPSWRNCGFLYSSDKKLQLCRLYILGDCEEGSPRPTSMRRSMTRNRQQSRVNSARYITAVSPVVDDKDPYNPTGLLQLDVLEEVLVTAEGVGGGLQMTPHTLQKQIPIGKSSAVVLACVTSRPIFRPSPSGKYCAVHWPESLYYIVLEMLPDFMSPSSNGKKTKEIDRGQCTSLGWMTINLADDIAGQKDLLLIISPSKRVDGTKKKKPQYSIFKKKDNTPEGCLPAMLLLKNFNDEGRVNEIVVTGGPDAVDELFGGGMLVCINSVSKMNDSGANDEKKKKAISQIELEAMQAQQAEEKSGAPVSKADEIPIHLSFKSQFFALKFGSKSRHPSAATVDESTTVSSIGDNDFALTPIGPMFDRANAVAWDTQRSCEGNFVIQYLAVLIDTRVNILKVSSCETSVSISTIRSIEVSLISHLNPTSLLWRDGLLFVSTYHEIIAMFPRPKDVANMTLVDSASLCSLSTPTQTILGTSGQFRPYGWLEIGTIIDGWVVLVSRDCVLTPLPLAGSSLTAILLQLSKISREGATVESLRGVAQFIQLFPVSMREYLIGLLSSWVKSDLLIEEVKKQCADMRPLTEVDLILSQGVDIDQQKVDQLAQQVNTDKYLRCNDLFGTISSAKSSQINGLNSIIQVAVAAATREDAIDDLIDASFPFDANSSVSNLQLLYGEI